MPHSRYKKERTTTFSPFCSFIVFDLLWEVSPRPPQSALRASEPFFHPFLSAREWGIHPPCTLRGRGWGNSEKMRIFGIVCRPGGADGCFGFY